MKGQQIRVHLKKIQSNQKSISNLYLGYVSKVTLREKCPHTEFFLVRIQENTGQKKLRIWTILTQCK